jgi:uncharacterized protein (DUF1501 family)
MSDHRLAAVSPRIAAAAREGCAESRLLLSRRAMLGVTAGLFTSAFMPRFASAASDPDARFLVVVLRGGMDGIGLLVPKLDPAYLSMRQNLAIDFAATLSLGSDFGLHPAMPNVHAMFTAGQAAFAPAAGLPLTNRSHFECQDNLENGLPANRPDATGWLNRLLGSLPAGDPIREAGGIEIGEAPLILQGPEPVLGWSPTWFEKSDPATVARLQTAYTLTDPRLWDSLSRGLEADALALAAGASGGDVSVLRKGFIGAARLLSAPGGPRVAVLSVDGWDMHASEGGVSGLMGDRLAELDTALNDLKTELGSAWAKTVAVCVTEFGRTVPANGSSGTDHGIASTALMVGGAVTGGFIGDWPGMAANQIIEGDALRPTVDMRALFKGVLRDHLGVPQEVLDTTVFPGSAALAAAGGLIAGARRATRLASAFQVPPSPQDVSPIALYRRAHGLGVQ